VLTKPRIIDAYRTTWREKHGTEPPTVAVAASILPGTTTELRETYASYDQQRRTEGMHASRPKGALKPVITADLPAGMRISPVFHGAPDEVVLFLPPAFELAENVRLLTDLASTVAPALGWRPAG
jgi:hypothetical protein